MNKQIQSVLAEVVVPYLESSLADAKIRCDIREENGIPEIAVEFPYPAASIFAEVEQDIITRLRLAGIDGAKVSCSSVIRPRIVQGGIKRLPMVKNVIAVASGKGGVGKSATAVNLALALSAEGARIGMLDADIYGPSLPVMLGINRRPQGGEDGGILPLVARGLQLMSIGFMVDEDQPMVWRGPIATRALSQLLEETKWDKLDYLILDMPPGTGDIQLTAAQKIPLTGAVIVTTPQDLALSDAQKGLVMFRKVSVSVLGVVENMSVYCCPGCGREEHIFGSGAAEKMCERYDVAFLGDLPLDASIRAGADSGCPTVAAAPESAIALRYRAIAHRVAAQVAQKPEDRTSAFPEVVVEK